MKTAFFIVALIMVVAYCFDTMEPTYPPGVLVSDEPSQRQVFGASPRKLGEYQITPLAEFRFRARVLHTEPYWLDHGADVSPVDLAVGWGRMSDQSVLDQISFSQGQRWYRYWPRKSDLPISIDEINTHSANMHMIPANKEVKKVLRSIRAGNLIELAGELVEAVGPDGSKWRSSLSRTDTGSGACELVWVEKVSVR